MSVSPDDIGPYAALVTQVYTKAETELLKLLTGHIAKAVDAGEMDTSRLRRAVNDLVQKTRQKAAQAVSEAVAAAAEQGEAGAREDTADVSTPPTGDPLDGRHERGLRETLDAAERGMKTWPVTVYQQVVAAAIGPATEGVETRRQAAQRALDALTTRGITGFTDSAGRSWELASYAEMATRTALADVAIDRHLDTLADAGLDLVIVSDSPRECPRCRPFEGKILTRSGQPGRVQAINPATGETVTVTVDATVREARSRGLLHPNCRHSLSAYMPGVTTPRGRAEPDGYDAQQRQRSIERMIRRWKRRETVALNDQARRKARARVRWWQSQLRAHLAANTDLKRQRHREQNHRAR